MPEAALRTYVAFLVVFFILWIGGFALYASWRHGVQSVAVRPHQTTGWQRVLIITALILDGYFIARAGLPVLDQWMLASNSPAPFLSLIIMAAGGLLMMATHIHMGASWRIGVPDTGNDITSLVTSGPHSFSRNPIYLAIMMMLTGMALAAPGPLTIAGLTVTFFGLQSIITEEEDYLQRQFGDGYTAYKARVRRWI